MSKEQLDQQSQQGATGQNAAVPRDDGFVEGLPPGLHAQVLAIRPGDAQALAELLKMYRESFATQILAAAARAPQLGNAVVQRAIKLADQRTLPDIAPGVMGHNGLATGDPGSLGNATREGGEFAPIASDPQPVAGAAPQASQPVAGATAQAGPAVDGGAEAAPAWAAGAQAYNTAHRHLVEEFNELTFDVCRLDGAAQVDVIAVARWQANHGLAADGKIGPHTVQKAREVSAAKGAAVAAAPQADARPPV